MISIAQISDTHLLCPVNVGETDIVKQRINNLKRCVDSINNLEPQPDIIIHTGDVTQNGTVEEYKIADSILKKLKQEIKTISLISEKFLHKVYLKRLIKNFIYIL